MARLRLALLFFRILNWIVTNWRCAHAGALREPRECIESQLAANTSRYWSDPELNTGTMGVWFTTHGATLMNTLNSWPVVLVWATLFCGDVGRAQTPNAGPKEAASAAPLEKSDAAEKPVFKQEELDQMLAPIALYPDSLIAQIFMASTYPLEVVAAERWVKKNKNLKGNSLTEALEQEDWDPSVKSLVNFPQVLTMMSEQLEWTQNLGDAFIAQQKQVMDTVQKLRAKAKAAGNLETSTEQIIIVKEEAKTQVIVIESATPEVIYVPTYNPTVVYGAWWYPAYPPRPYYPPGYVAGTAAVSFGVGVAAGAAWGYAWGGCGWGHGDVDIDVNRNVFANNNINRARYNQNIQNTNINNRNTNINNQNTNINNRNVQSSGNSWQHDSGRRGGTSAQTAQARDSYRGRAESGRQDLARGGADAFKGGQTPARGGQGQAAKRPDAKPSGTASRENRAGSGAQNRGGSTAQNRGGSGGGGAFGDVDRGRSATQAQSNRGQSSRATSNRSGGGSRPSGGGSRGGGGGRGGGGRR